MNNKKKLADEIYAYLKDNDYIVKNAESEKLETDLFKKLEEFGEKEELSNEDIKELEDIYKRAIAIDEANGIVVGFYMVDRLRNKFNLNKIK